MFVTWAINTIPGKARIDAPGALHHIIIRGIERLMIFQGPADQTNFLKRPGRIIHNWDELQISVNIVIIKHSYEIER